MVLMDPESSLRSSRTVEEALRSAAREFLRLIAEETEDFRDPGADFAVSGIMPGEEATSTFNERIKKNVENTKQGGTMSSLTLPETPSC